MSVGAAEGFHSFQLSKRNLFIENFLSQKSAQKKNSPVTDPSAKTIASPICVYECPYAYRYVEPYKYSYSYDVGVSTISF